MKLTEALEKVLDMAHTCMHDRGHDDKGDESVKVVSILLQILRSWPEIELETHVR